jgi:hypothetical protein
MRRWFIVVTVTLGVGALAPSPAAAEPSGTVSFAVVPGTVVQGQPVAITVSGTSSQAGELAIYYTDGSSPSCLSVKSIRETPASPTYSPSASTPVSAGSYSQTYSFTPTLSGTYMVCGYLYDPSSSTGAIYAAGTGSFNATYPVTVFPGAPPEPPPPPLPHLTSLTVEILSHPGHTAAKPGVTDIKIWAPHVNAARVVLKRLHHAETREQSWKGEQGTVAVPWTCSRPGGVYVLTVTATDTYGKTLTRHEKFRPVSAARCRALHAVDARRRREEAAARPREERGEERREREEAPTRKAQEDQEEYCQHVLGGYPLETLGEGSVVTDCYVGRLVYILAGDPPKIVTVRERQ